MKILKAKIKKISKYYKNGLNQKKKTVWLKILDFRAEGEKNYKIEAVKEIKNGMPVFFNLWLAKEEIIIKKFEDGQLRIIWPEENIY
jgi:hypothetical protein